MSMRTNRQVGPLTNVVDVVETLAENHVRSPNARAGVVPGRTTIASSALVHVAEYSQAITTTRVPLSLASVSQWASGIWS